MSMHRAAAMSGVMGLLMSSALLAAAPDPAESAAAVKAADAWLAVLDRNDLQGAAAQVSPEALAALNKPHDQAVGLVAAVLASGREDQGERSVERHLKEDSITAASGCGECLVKTGHYIVMTYAVKYTWDYHHIRHYRDGTEVVDMFREPDGSWTLGGITQQLSGNHTFPGK
jgi:hypothetical protein